ncbi:MAG TPA: sulfatase-like hydrolase/transferase [Pirellulaceae bacterium]|nr:sulfatase-like hydrolase/transferase [Pirellulaceae bacterium]
MKTILTFCYSLLLLTAFASAEVKQPNVVTLLVDDLGYRDIGCYGGPVKTPVLDKLAAGGVRFTDFHSGAPVCSPSRATFLTGRNHIRAGVYSVLSEQRHRMHLLRSETTLAEVLKDEGYATAHFGKWHLGMPVNGRDNPTPADHGFDYWFGLVNGAHPSHKDPTNFLRNGKPVGPMKGYSCQIVVDEAIAWLDEKRDADAPFFLNLWFNEPHAVIAAPDEIVSDYGALNDQAAIYNGTIDNTDRAIGRLVAKLEKLGELDNTIISYSSDNGSYRQDRCGKLRGKKGSHFEGGHRVPGIFYWKGKIPGGRVEDEPAGAVDLLPTICGLLRIDKPEGVHLDGSDLTPLLTRTGAFERHQPLFWMNGSTMVLRMGDYTLSAPSTAKLPFDHAKANRLMQQTKIALGDDLEKELGGLDLRSRMFNGRFANPEANRLRDEFRAMFYFNEALIPLMKKGGVDRVQLYDLASDLSQKRDIAAQKPELVAQLKKKANAIYQSVMADAPDWGQKPLETTPNNPSSPGFSLEDRKLADLLTRIDQTELPGGYDVRNHQPWVDRRMETLKPEQRGRIGRLWKEKRRLQPKMQNAGMSFVRILEYVARGEKLTANSAPRPAAPLPQRKNKPVVSEIDPKGHHWHQWRGPESNGVSRTAKPPLEWSEDRNIKWKIAIKGQGNASPIVWGDKVFVLTAINTGRVDPSLPKPEDQPKRVFGIKHPNTFYKFEVLCLDRQTGKELWRQTASEHVPHEGTHHDADFASASPTTDGERLYCWFGSAGMYCYDLNGKKLWQRDLGKAYVGASLGEGCSPVVYKGKVVIVRDHARQSSIEVLDARTGRTLWKKDRDEPNAWATPRVVEHSGKTQVITAASNWIRSYDLDSGDIIWQCSGLTGNVTPSPIVDGDVVYCMSGYEGYSLLALPLDARGDISNSDKIIWSKDRGTPYVPSPVLYDGMLYFTQSNQSILTAVDSRTGKTLLQRGRIPGVSNIYSSPVGADGRVYFTGRNGATVVLKRQNKLKVLATNKLDDEFNASPAIAGRQLFLRGRKSLYCLENRAGGADSGKKASIEAEIRIHRLATTRRSAFDAFSYVNRIPEKPYDDETAEEFAGRIFSRLANQEGRVLLKAPPGMDRLAYDGFKTFLRYEGAASVGNCAACHTPADFTDGESHVVSKGGTAKPTPSLRNLVKRRVDLRKTLLQKLETSRQKRSGTADEISEAYSAMNLSERDIRGLAAFLKLLEDVPDDRFRKLILDAKVLNTSKE